MASGIRRYNGAKRINIAGGLKTAFVISAFGTLMVGTVLVAYVAYPLISDSAQEQPAVYQEPKLTLIPVPRWEFPGDAKNNTTSNDARDPFGGIRLDNILYGQGNNVSDNGGFVGSNIGGLDAIVDRSRNSKQGTQAGFLSQEVTSYSAQGYGGMTARLPKPSTSLNYFYLIIKDDNDKLVRFSQYEHGFNYTLMEMSHEDTVFFTWDNILLPPGKYIATIVKGPSILFGDSRLQVLSERQFEVKPYDFSANNAQNTSTNGYSMHAAKDLLTVLAPADKRFGIDSIDVKIYDKHGNIIWKEDTIITDKYQFEFNRNKVPLMDYKAEAVITYRVRNDATGRDVEKKVILAAQFPGKG